MNYSNSVETILKKLPELESAIDPDVRDLPEVALGDFAIYLRKQIGKSDKESFVGKSIEILNEMAESQDLQIVGLLSTGIVEVLLDDREKIEYIKKHARSELLKVIERVHEFWTKPR